MSITCPQCQGIGQYYCADKFLHHCSVCNGSGKVENKTVNEGRDIIIIEGEIIDYILRHAVMNKYPDDQKDHETPIFRLNIQKFENTEGYLAFKAKLRKLIREHANVSK